MQWKNCKKFRTVFRFIRVKCPAVPYTKHSCMDNWGNFTFNPVDITLFLCYTESNTSCSAYKIQTTAVVLGVEDALRKSKICVKSIRNEDFVMRMKSVFSKNREYAK